MENGVSFIHELPWNSFDSTRVQSHLIPLVKTASVVEFNGRNYGEHLIQIFPDDEKIHEDFRRWSEEEEQHGVVLSSWAKLADPEFQFEKCFQTFTEGFRPFEGLTSSRRGSRSAELVARCIVETGTNTFYTALSEASDEPLLKEISRRIALDEMRHYHLFQSHLTRYLKKDPLTLWKKLRIAIQRIAEVNDDEFAYAYYSVTNTNLPYDQKEFIAAYLRRGLPLYRPRHFERMAALTSQAIGVKPRRWVNKAFARVATYRSRSLTAPLHIL